MFGSYKLKINSLFLKKHCEKFCQYRESPYLCIRFREATEVYSSDVFLCSLPEKLNEIFDRLRTSIQDKQRVPPTPYSALQG